jgi:hypothetical protein
MTRTEVSKITCAVDARLSHAIDSALGDMAIPEAFIQRGKQLSFLERSRLFGLGSRVDLSESRTELYRFYVPTVLESAAARRVAEAADLYLPGRGTLFAESVEILSSAEPVFDPVRIASSCPDSDCGKPLENHAVLCCIVQRGMGEALARTALEMGLCVPIVSYGEGMGLRNKLGLLRITIPVDKEILYFVVPERDADLMESVAVHKARLDRPGQGFIYRFNVRAYAINLRIRGGTRSHAASMEQVISALDVLRGSSEWRRFATTKTARKGKERVSADGGLVCLSLTAEEGSVGACVRVAMEAGAGGATLVPLARRRYDGLQETDPANARESCDLIVNRALSDPILGAIEASGLFAETSHGMAELSSVSHALTYSGWTALAVVSIKRAP